MCVMARKRRSLTIVFHDGPDIPDEVLREAWELRLEMLTLTTTPEEDWASFSGVVRGEDRCLFSFVDREGRIQGFFSYAYLPVDHDGRRGVLVYSKYWYFRPDYRGHYKTMVAPWYMLSVIARKYRTLSMHFVTTAFPQSYVSLSRTASRVYSLREGDTPSWEREALRVFARAFSGPNFDDTTGLVGGSNVPDAPSLPKSEEAQRLHEKYECLNPEWRRGFALPILFSLNRDLVYHNLKRILRRSLANR